MLKYTAAANDDATSRPIPHDQDFRAFVEPLGLFGHRDAQGDRLGYDYDGYGVMTGVDLKLSPEWIVGVAGGYLRSDLDYNQALGTATIDTARIGPYAGATFGRWLLDASVSFGYHWIDSTRAVDVPGLGAANATANYNAYDISSYLGLGYRFHPTKRINIIPMASVDYTYFDNQSFTESGGPAGTSLAVASTGINSLRSSLGVGANTWFRTSGVKVVPEISMAWVHEFFDNNKISATFADGVTPFTVQSGGGKYDGMTVGGGVSVLFRKNISAFLRYGLDYVPRDTAHTLGAGVTIGF
jgi:outer membrane autotransporter protein